MCLNMKNELSLEAIPADARANRGDEKTSQTTLQAIPQTAMRELKKSLNIINRVY